MVRFGERLKELREKHGMSQQQLADELSISRSTIGNYELGSREPSFEVLEEFADLFNVDMNYLIGKSSIERKVPLSSESENSSLFTGKEPMTDREERMLSNFRLLSNEMQDKLLDLTEATAKSTQQNP